MTRNKTAQKDEEPECADEARTKQPCCSKGMPEMMSSFCRNADDGELVDMAAMRRKCCAAMKKSCRWFPVISLAVAGASFLFGYYLRPEIVRSLWLATSGFFVLLACVCLVMTNVMCKN